MFHFCRALVLDATRLHIYILCAILWHIFILAYVFNRNKQRRKLKGLELAHECWSLKCCDVSPGSLVTSLPALVCSCLWLPTLALVSFACPSLSSTSVLSLGLVRIVQILGPFPNHFPLTPIENVIRSRKDVKENSRAALTIGCTILWRHMFWTGVYVYAGHVDFMMVFGFWFWLSASFGPDLAFVFSWPDYSAWSLHWLPMYQTLYEIASVACNLVLFTVFTPAVTYVVLYQVIHNELVNWKHFWGDFL